MTVTTNTNENNATAIADRERLIRRLSIDYDGLNNNLTASTITALATRLDDDTIDDLFHQVGLAIDAETEEAKSRAETLEREVEDSEKTLAEETTAKEAAEARAAEVDAFFDTSNPCPFCAKPMPADMTKPCAFCAEEAKEAVVFRSRNPIPLSACGPLILTKTTGAEVAREARRRDAEVRERWRAGTRGAGASGASTPSKSRAAGAA